MLSILTFDCILYGKKTGFFYHIFHCCGKAYKQQSQEIGGCKLRKSAHAFTFLLVPNSIKLISR